MNSSKERKISPNHVDQSSNFSHSEVASPDIQVPGLKAPMNPEGHQVRNIRKRRGSSSQSIESRKSKKSSKSKKSKGN